MSKDARGHGSNKRGVKAANRAKTAAALLSARQFTERQKELVRDGKTPQDAFNQAHAEKSGANTAQLMEGMKNKLSGDITAGRMIASEPKSGSSYYGRALSKTGRAIGETGPHADHETAASATFAAHPNAKSVSTARGYGFDIRFHNRN